MSDDTVQPGADATETEAPKENEKSFDEAYVKKLREEAAAYRVKLKEYEDRDKSETEKLQERAQLAEQELQKARREQSRLSVAAKYGISADYLDLLHGDSDEQLEAQATKIAALMETKTQPSRVLVGEQGEPAPLALNGDGIEEALKRALGIN